MQTKFEHTLVVLFAEKALTDDEIQELLFGDESNLDVDSDSGDEAENFQPESALHSEKATKTKIVPVKMKMSKTRSLRKHF